MLLTGGRYPPVGPEYFPLSNMRSKIILPDFTGHLGRFRYFCTKLFLKKDFLVVIKKFVQKNIKPSNYLTG